MTLNEEIKREIKANIDLDYLSFHSSLVPNIHTIEGVRIPILRSIAKTISKKEEVFSYLDNPTLDTYEEITIYGLVIGYLKLDIKEYQYYLKKFIPYIDNWATCDVVASNLKWIKKYKKQMYPFILSYLKSKKEFEVRFSIIMLMNYYLDDYYEEIFSLLCEIKLDYYYVKMAIAWLISNCYIKHKKETLAFLKNNSLDNWTHNKSIQKIIESNRVLKEDKEYLKTLKRI